MKKSIAGLLTVSIFLFFVFAPLEAKKIKHSLRVEKEEKSKNRKADEKEGIEICLADSLNLKEQGRNSLLEELQKCSFYGFEKETNVNYETFLLKNTTNDTITGFEVRIDYLDMQGRMLHSRTVKEKGEVPPHETRKFDIPSWDKQHTYYYYLGNKPKKVAIPFKVSFTPISFHVK